MAEDKMNQTAEEEKKAGQAEAEAADSNTEKTEDTEQKTETADKAEKQPEAEKQDADKDSGDSAEDAAENKSDKDEDKSEGDSSENAADASDKKDRKFFGKKKKDDRDQKIADLTDRVQRQMAEFDNFRKRTEKEKSEMFDAGARNILEKILPVVDNFERALALKPEGDEDAFTEGMEKIYKGLVKTLTDLDVKEIEAQGKEFDPNLHNAVMHVDDDQYGENEVVEVLQKGYTYHDTVIRHAMVKVAN